MSKLLNATRIKKGHGLFKHGFGSFSSNLEKDNKIIQGKMILCYIIIKIMLLEVTHYQNRRTWYICGG